MVNRRAVRAGELKVTGSQEACSDDDLSRDTALY